MTPQITVIIGTYNPSIERIRNAIRSIVNQSFREWELILYDDGSSFDVSDSIRDLVQMDGRIIVVHGENNKGLAHSLNKCLSIAKGTYIARMDDDDVSDSKRFETQKRFLDDNPEYGWVGSQAILYDNDGTWGIARRPEIPIKKDFLHSSPFIHPSVMIRREVLRAVNGYAENNATKRCEDYDLFMNLYSKGYKGYNIQIPLIHYFEDRYLLRRSWKYAINESIIRFVGFSKMGILQLHAFPYVIKPIIVRVIAFCPKLAQYIRTNYRNRNVSDKRLYN